MSRPLTPAEREVLTVLLAGDFAGATELRAQAETARVTGRCGCGCPTVDLEVDATLPVAEVTERAAVEVDAPDGGLIVFVDDGRLSGLEYWTTGDEPPVAFPAPEEIRSAEEAHQRDRDQHDRGGEGVDPGALGGREAGGGGAVHGVS